MIKKNFSRKFWLVAAFYLIFTFFYSNAFAGERRGDWPRPLPPKHEVVMVHGGKYHYNDGRFYRPWFFGFGFTVAVPPLGAVVTVLPFRHRTIVVAGATYYYDDIYYRPCSSGYIVVPAPTVNSGVGLSSSAIQIQRLSGVKVIINVPNSNGSYTPVTLIKQKDGCIGPQGEYYPGHPTVKQLKFLYSK